VVALTRPNDERGQIQSSSGETLGSRKNYENVFEEVSAFKTVNN